MPNEETRRIAGEIEESLDSLTEAVGVLTHVQARQLSRMRRMLVWTAVGLLFDLGLSGVGGVLYLQVHDNARQLQSVNERVSSQALCPLYDVLLRSWNPESPAAKADPAEYDRDFAVIERGAQVMGCPHSTRGR